MTLSQQLPQNLRGRFQGPTVAREPAFYTEASVLCGKRALTSRHCWWEHGLSEAISGLCLCLRHSLPASCSEIGAHLQRAPGARVLRAP